MTRIKDIKFTKKESLDNNDKNVTKYVTTTENIEIKSELSDLSQNSNKFELKNIDNDHIIKNGENQLTTEAQEQLQDTVIKRNKTKTFFARLAKGFNFEDWKIILIFAFRIRC